MVEADTHLPLVFISYARKDLELRRELEKPLRWFERQRLLKLWSDAEIDAGQEWKPMIRERLDTADIILLLISHDFLASDFCCEEELKRAMERHEAGEAQVIPVFLRPCPWDGEVFGKLQGVPDNATPVTEWPNRDRAFTIVAEAVRKAADSQRARVAERERVRAAEREAERRWPDFHVFRDAPFAPEMVVLPAGEFWMGSPDNDEEAFDDEKPQHRVRIGYRLAVGRYPVTFAEWDACVADGGVDHNPSDRDWGRSRRPVIAVSWEDARQYLAWLSRKTGKIYRLLSEAEWEYAARAGTMTRRWWGDDITPDKANYGRNIDRTTEVGTYPENPFKLYDVLGNVWEWVDDCYEDSYNGAPIDGSARQISKNSARVLRGGSWGNDPGVVRSAYRDRSAADVRSDYLGFRVARTF